MSDEAAWDLPKSRHAVMRERLAIAEWLLAEKHHQLKQAHKQLGKQGQTIHQLRCEIAELRSLMSPEDRQQMRLWLTGQPRQNMHLQINLQHRIIKNLRAQIDRNHVSS